MKSDLDKEKFFEKNLHQKIIKYIKILVTFQEGSEEKRNKKY